MHKGKMGVFVFFLASPTQCSLTQAPQWRREAAPQMAGTLHRPSQRYLVSGICWRSNVRATNPRCFWMLWRETDYKEGFNLQVSKYKAEKLEGKEVGSFWFCLTAQSSLVFTLH